MDLVRLPVLLAHAKQDMEIARWLAEPLEQAGYRVVYQNSMLVGESLPGESSKALSVGAPVILCGTARAAGSKWARKLVNAAHGYPTGRVFAVQMEEDAELEHLAYDATFACYWQDPHRAIVELLTALRKHYPLPGEDDRSGIVADDDRDFIDQASGIVDFNGDVLRRFRLQLRDDIAEDLPSDLDDVEFLRRANLMQGRVLTRAGVLMFGRNAMQVLRSALAKCVAYHGIDQSAPREHRDFSGSIPEQIVAARDFMASRIKQVEAPMPSSASAAVMYEYPMICVREVIANALVHRDYQDGNRNAHFRIFSNRIEIVSPGEWVAKPLEPGVAYSLKQLQTESSKKNFTLAKVLSWIRLVEGEGSGIPAAVVNCQEIGAPIPEVIQQDGFVKVIIRPIPDWPPLASEFARLQEAQEPFHCGIVGIDIEGYARPERTDPIRSELRTKLYRLSGDALAQAGIPPSSIVRTDIGDGLLLLVSPRISTTRLLHPFATGLAARLADSNRDVPATQRLRVRIAVHAGTVLADANGFVGASLVHAARLLDATTVRTLLADHSAAAALITSDEVYQSVVRHAYAGIDPAGWQAIRVHAKEVTTRAWIHMPGLTTQPSLPTVLATSRAAPASVPIPHELPRPVADFTGREGQLEVLMQWLHPDDRSGGPSIRPLLISVIDGMGGVGKSALAIQVAYQLADAFPDGQLYIDLQGASPGVGPLTPHEALSRMLRSLGADPAEIPVGVEEAAARFRSLAAERRLLVVLDNAASPEQVRFLLPGSPTCGVLVTSRHALAMLEGTHAIHLDVFSQAEALELLSRLIGQQRIAAEPETAHEVVASCGRLPLAIRIAGAWLARRPGSQVRTLVERLTDTHRRLETLQVGGLGLRGSFDASLNALLESPDQRDRAAAAAFGVLSLPEGPDIGLATAARLLEQPESITEELLERLVEAHLLESHRPGRYQFHSLVRLYAREFAMSQHGDSDWLAMLTRMIGFYTATTWRAMALLWPVNQRVATGDPRWSDDGLQFADAPTALAWLEVEHVNLLLAINQAAMTTTTDTSALLARLAGELARALFGFLDLRGYWQAGLQVNRIVLELARRERDRYAEAYASNDLGAFHQRMGQYQEAISCLQHSLSLFRELGDRQGQASSLDRLGLVQWRLGRSTEAISSQRESLSLYREAGNHYGEAKSLSNLGIVYSQVNEHAEAVDLLQESLNLFRELGDRQGHAISMNNLGNVYDRLGRSAEAVDLLQESLSLFRELGDRRGEAEALRDLGDALRAVGRDDQARLAWQEALGICEMLQIPETDEVRVRLAASPSETVRPDAKRGLP